MKILLEVFVICLIFGQIICPPVKEQKKGDENNENSENEIPTDKDDLEDYMEYHRYLKEVVNALESDPEFRKKLEKADEADIRNGKIAHELEFVSHHVRNQLDEIKRAEIERLRHLASLKNNIENGIVNENHSRGASHGGNSIDDSDVEHLDHQNPHTFEIEDLKKLIAKTSQDLAEADKKRREEFKNYEMQKEFEKQEKLKALDEEKRKEMEKQIQEQVEKHKKHAPLHHPGSKQQLEEVWEKQDHMDSQDFDPKTFFMLHDLDGNGHWDQNEVKALFLKELDKLYQAGTPEDDMRERAEEMERMREHVFNEADVNRDGLISFQEFLDQTRKPDFNQDPGWEGLDQQKVYTQEEYQEFERRRLEEVQRLIAQGIFPPQGHHPNQQYHPNMQPQYQPPPQGAYAQHPQQYGQQHPGNIQAQQAQYHQAQQQAQYHQGQGGQQYHPQQVPQYQQHPNQVNPGNNIPPHGNQVPPQGGNVPPSGVNTQNQNPPVVPQQPSQNNGVPHIPVNDQNQQLNSNTGLNNQQSPPLPAANVDQNSIPVNGNQNNIPPSNKQSEENSIKQ
ncbi:nucleobindin-2 isoform X2 [Chrysoperla carnea]|uniref:nucleobindin-2 isoform X2 n=1 Tax=Chrysoperla carnea TaxID=189513 RepID=UPI001D08DB1E|nr:nucleobindin-2 isoform X2 [Chrysoperla carnea]